MERLNMKGILILLFLALTLPPLVGAKQSDHYLIYETTLNYNPKLPDFLIESSQIKHPKLTGQETKLIFDVTNFERIGSLEVYGYDKQNTAISEHLEINASGRYMTKIAFARLGSISGFVFLISRGQYHLLVSYVKAKQV
jgi:hypothetical protein